MIIRLKTILTGAAALFLIGVTIRLAAAPLGVKDNSVPAISFKPPVKTTDSTDKGIRSGALKGVKLKKQVKEASAESRSTLMATALEYKLQVSRTRSLKLDNMKTLVETGSDPQVKLNAEKEVAKLSQAQEHEIEAEIAAAGLGYNDAVASMNGETLRIFVDQVLTPGTVTVLGSLISERTGISMEKIVIVQKQNG